MLSPGERVLVPTEVKSGAFPNERFVTVETQEGPISGFAQTDSIVEQDTGNYLFAEVQNVTPQALTVKLFASFFTTTGLATMAPSGILKATG